MATDRPAEPAVIEHHHPGLTGMRRDIVVAARDVVRERGLAAATTRAIAERAGCSEGLIYRHFPDKASVFMEIVRMEFPYFLELMMALPDKAGTGAVRENLEEVATQALAFHRGILPMIAGCVAQRDLLLAQRRWFLETRRGPLRHLEALTEYLKREQELGRISDTASAAHAARLLLGTSFAQAFLLELMGESAALGSDPQFAERIVSALLEGLEAKGA
jgi:AcrR family transcriptional regulator